MTLLVQGHEGYVSSVSFSPDGSLIASGSWDKTVRICSVKDGALVGGASLSAEKFIPIFEFDLS